MMHLNSELLFGQYALPYFGPDIDVLELGPDGSPSSYQRSVADPSIRWATADLADSSSANGDRLFGTGSAADVSHTMTDPYTIPIENDRFDIVLSGQVIEHVPAVWTWMSELARVCRPNGLVITIGPSSWPYHEAPVDCWRVYPEGLRALCEASGLYVVQAVSASLEPRPSRRAYPGASYGPSTGARGSIKRVLGRLGWPLPFAVDTIAIARKPSSENRDLRF